MNSSGGGRPYPRIWRSLCTWECIRNPPPTVTLPECLSLGSARPSILLRVTPLQVPVLFPVLRCLYAIDVLTSYPFISLLDPGLLTVGQYAWMEHDLFLLAVRPLFLSYGLSEFRVKILIEDAQQDLYYPLIRPYSCVHVTHARKVPSWTAPRRRTHRVR